MTPLWTAQEIADATGGTVHGGAFEVTGVAFDSREIEPGFLFVAMPGTVHDGHDFVDGAFERGAVAALVSRDIGERPHVRVDDVTAALDALARAARTRVADDAVIVGVTGSVGKTSTKEALYCAFERTTRGQAHRSVKSYNNHTGVPLSLARMPRDTRVGIFEMGMNHAGEIAAHTRLVRPHIAMITAIAPAHIENLGTIEAIADAKAEIFEGLEPGGTAIVPDDIPQTDRLVAAARGKAERILCFGGTEGDAAVLHTAQAAQGGSLVTARLPGRRATFTIAQRGQHWILNALAVLSAVAVAGHDVAIAALALADMGGLKGRGERHDVSLPGGGSALVIDESYNANPASMAATLATLGDEEGRRIAVLGAMKELGVESDSLHAALADPVRAAGVALAVLVGLEMDPLAEALGQDVTVQRVADADEAMATVPGLMRDGDVVLVKASNSVGLGKLVDKLAGGQA